jgi:hypothetical protein
MSSYTSATYTPSQQHSRPPSWTTQDLYTTIITSNKCVPPFLSKKARPIEKAKIKGGKSIRLNFSATDLTLLTRNVQGLKDPSKLETIIDEVNSKGIYAYMDQ